MIVLVVECHFRVFGEFAYTSPAWRTYRLPESGVQSLLYQTHISFDRWEWAGDVSWCLVLLPAYPFVPGSSLVVVNNPLGAADDLGSWDGRPLNNCIIPFFSLFVSPAEYYCPHLVFGLGFVNERLVTNV